MRCVCRKADNPNSGGTAAVSHIHKEYINHLESYLNPTSNGVPGPSDAESYQNAIQSALTNTDVDISAANFDGGATVALALIDTAQNILVTADLGDSHIVLATHSPHKGSIGQKENLDWDVEVLSEEHIPDNPKEKKRIEDSGGEVTYSTGIPRIGGVAMSRALGDMEYKKPRVNRLAGHDLSDLGGIHTGVRKGATVTDNLVSNEAHFTNHTITTQSILVLASDGVGDAPEAEEDTRAVVDMYSSGRRDLKKIAKEVTKSAGKVDNADNCTVMIIVLDVKNRTKRDSGSGTTAGAVEFEIEPAGLEARMRKWSGSSSRRSSRRSSSFSSMRDSIKDFIKS